MKLILLIFFILVNSFVIRAQKFYLGNYLVPTENEFELVGISTKTGVATYKYRKEIYDKFFERDIDDIIVGIRDEHITLTIYNLIPKKTDVGVPKDIIDLIEKKLPFPFKKIDGAYGVNIDNETISISRNKSSITFGKDRIVFMNSIKQSILESTKK